MTKTFALLLTQESDQTARVSTANVPINGSLTLSSICWIFTVLTVRALSLTLAVPVFFFGGPNVIGSAKITIFCFDLPNHDTSRWDGAHFSFFFWICKCFWAIFLSELKLNLRVGDAAFKPLGFRKFWQLNSKQNASIFFLVILFLQKATIQVLPGTPESTKIFLCGTVWKVLFFFRCTRGVPTNSKLPRPAHHHPAGGGDWWAEIPVIESATVCEYSRYSHLWQHLLRVALLRQFAAMPTRDLPRAFTKQETPWFDPTSRWCWFGQTSVKDFISFTEAAWALSHMPWQQYLCCINWGKHESTKSYLVAMWRLIT